MRYLICRGHCEGFDAENLFLSPPVQFRAGTVRQPNAKVDKIPQSGTKNLASEVCPSCVLHKNIRWLILTLKIQEAACDPVKSYRKPLVTIKFGAFSYGGVDIGEHRKITAKEILRRGSGSIFRIFFRE
jgi:hypothetical protein